MKEFSDTLRTAMVLFILCFSLASTAFGQSWIQENSSTPNNLNDVWVSASVNPTPPPAVSLRMFGVGQSGTIVTSTNGTLWTSQSISPNDLNAVWGGATDNVYAVGNTNTVFRFNGEVWSSIIVNGSEGLNLYDVWGYTTGTTPQVYAVGELGTIIFYNGTTWAFRKVGNFNLKSVWGTSSTDIFVVGNQGTILHYDGQSWVPQVSGTQSNLNSVWGTSPQSVFAVGDDGVILWYDGEDWLKLQNDTTIPANAKLTGVWGTSYCNVYAVGESLGHGVIFFFDGSSWSSLSSRIVMDPPGAQVSPLRGIHGDSLRDIFSVGDAGGGSGLILNHDPEGPGLPSVCAKQPANEEEGVLIDTTISAAFNAVMNASTITASTFTLSSASGQVTGTVTYSNNIATFTPSDQLARSTTYTATLSKDIKDPLGFSIGTENYTWSFTTGSESSGGSSGGGCFISAARKASSGKDRFRALKNIFGRFLHQRYQDGL